VSYYHYRRAHQFICAVFTAYSSCLLHLIYSSNWRLWSAIQPNAKR